VIGGPPATGGTTTAPTPADTAATIAGETPTTAIGDPTVPMLQLPPTEAGEEPQDEDEEDEEVIITIPEPEVPLAIFSDGKSWALMNLIIGIAGAIQALMIGTHILMMKKKEREGELEGIQTGPVSDKLKRRRFILALATPAFAISGLVLFILTQDMRLPMTMVDWWTPANAAIFYGGAQSYIYAFRIGKDDDSDTGKPLGAQA